MEMSTRLGNHVRLPDRVLDAAVYIHSCLLKSELFFSGVDLRWRPPSISHDELI